jgi:hypothetical protein
VRDDPAVPEHPAREVPPVPPLPWEAAPPPSAPWPAPAPERPAAAPGPPRATYGFRMSALHPHRTYTLDDEALWAWEGGAAVARVPLETIRAVWLDEVRGRSVRHFVCHVKTAEGRTFTLRHQSYRGFADFVDQRGEYRAFVGALLATLAGRGHVRFRAGSALRFWTAWPMIALVAAIGVFMASLGATPVAWACAIGGVAMLLHTLAARPRDVNPHAPPRSLLPS